MEDQALSPSFDLDPPPSAPTPSPVSKLDRRDTAGLRKRDNLLTGKGGWEGAKSCYGKKAWSSLCKSSILSDRDTLYTPKPSCVSRGRNFKVLLHNKLRLPKVLSMAHIVKILNRFA